MGFLTGPSVCVEIQANMANLWELKGLNYFFPPDKIISFSHYSPARLAVAVWAQGKLLHFVNWFRTHSDFFFFKFSLADTHITIIITTTTDGLYLKLPDANMCLPQAKQLLWSSCRLIALLKGTLAEKKQQCSLNLFNIFSRVWSWGKQHSCHKTWISNLEANTLECNSVAQCDAGEVFASLYSSANFEVWQRHMLCIW